MATILFGAPANDGGSDITGYTVTQITPTPSAGQVPVNGASSPITVTGLTNGIAYTFTVTATNAVGISIAASTSVTPAGAPDAPTIVTATATGVSGEATVTFTAPANNGDAAITTYTVTSSSGGITATGASSPITITGLANGTAYTFSVTATNSVGTGAASAASNSVTPAPPPIIYEVTNPTTGRVWMDRNLGATQVATSSNDAEAYGDLYPWGRGTDGHQIRTSANTSTLSDTDVPGHGNFITNGSSPYDWRSGQNDNLWQGVNGINNPCPSGYRLPTDLELNAERTSWNSNNAAGAFASPLKFTVAGFRLNSNGSVYGVGSGGLYWSSTVDGTFSRRLSFNSSNAGMSSLNRASGFSVRCIKD